MLTQDKYCWKVIQIKAKLKFYWTHKPAWNCYNQYSTQNYIQNIEITKLITKLQMHYTTKV